MAGAFRQDGAATGGGTTIVVPDEDPPAVLGIAGWLTVMNMAFPISTHISNVDEVSPYLLVSDDGILQVTVPKELKFWSGVSSDPVPEQYPVLLFMKKVSPTIS